MSGHTPGPWRVEDDTNLIWGACDPDDQTTSGMGYPVAECCSPRSWSKQHVPTWEQRVANARLIAAAPDLLAALEAAVACGMVPVTSAKEGGASKYSAQVDAADMIRAAIAKARGATP